MTIEGLVDRYLSYWREADIDGLMSMYDTDVQYHDMPSGDVIGYGDLKQYILETFAFTANETLKLKNAVYLDNGSAFVYLTQSLASEDKGQSVTVNGVELITFSSGFIVSVHDFYDYQDSAQDNEKVSPKDEQAEQMVKLGLTDELIAELGRDILIYFDQHRPHVNPDLSLSMVADALGYTRNQISYVINHGLGETFYDLVNTRRVDHVIEQMSSANSASSILELAINAGFNSMSGFYNAFKKQTGTTPVKFRKDKLS